MMAPEEFEYYPGLDRTFSGVTLRQNILRTLPGRTIRVTFSNEYGRMPLRIGQAHIASQLRDARTDPATDVELLFAGQRSASIPAGGRLESDPVSLAVPDALDLAVSIYLPDSTLGSTSSVHEEGWRTGYVSPPGDFAGSSDFPIADQLHNDFYLAALDVLAPCASSAIVAFGDSITDGTGATPGKDRKWPDELARRLAGHHPGRYAVVNMAIGGNRLLKPSTGPSGLERSARDLFQIPGARVLVVLEGVNDIAGEGDMTRAGITASQLIAGFRSLIREAHERGLIIVGATITPTLGCKDCGGSSGERVRQDFNAWVRASHEFDATIDFDRAVRDADDPRRLRPQFDSGDHLHLSDAGYQAMAGAAERILERLLAKASARSIPLSYPPTSSMTSIP